MIEEIPKLANIEQASQYLKLRCGTDKRTILYYDHEGLHALCRHCKGYTLITWEELQLKYAETHPPTAEKSLRVKRK